MPAARTALQLAYETDAVVVGVTSRVVAVVALAVVVVVGLAVVVVVGFAVVAVVDGTAAAVVEVVGAVELFVAIGSTDPPDFTSPAFPQAPRATKTAKPEATTGRRKFKMTTPPGER